MELPRRQNDDVFLPDGAMTGILGELQAMDDAHDLRIGIVYAFDPRTHLLPYWYADSRMAPCSVRLLGDLLNAAGSRGELIAGLLAHLADHLGQIRLLRGLYLHG